MAIEEHDTDRYREATFDHVDLGGATFRDCRLSGIRVADSELMDIHLDGWVDRLLVNGVDVTAFVDAELDRRHPERVQLRSVRTADDYRAMWATLEGLWAGAVERARRLPEAAQQERVDGEWSFVETMRHLVFATDAWAYRTVLDEPMPYHRLGLNHSSYDTSQAAALGIDAEARPSLDEVLEVRADRMGTVRRLVEALTAEELGRICTRAPAPGYPEKERTVGECLRVVMDEECEHYRYAVRDLAVLESRS